MRAAMLRNVRVPQFEILTWLANMLLVASAIIVSLKPGAAVGPSVFLAYAFGHAFFAGRGWRLGDAGQFLSNAAFLLLDIYAIGIRL